MHLKDFFRMLLSSLLDCFNILKSSLEIFLYDLFTVFKTCRFAGSLKWFLEASNAKGLLSDGKFDLWISRPVHLVDLRETIVWT